jgi:hypothetical protein
MLRPTHGPLWVLQRLLRALIALNLVMGALILALLIASLLFERPVMGALGVPPHEGSDRLITGMRVIMVIGLLAVPLGHAVLTRLREIAASVALGDPFMPENAARLTAIAWTVLAIEGLHLAVGFTSYITSSAEVRLQLGWSPSITRWLAIVLCFTLARVFAHGRRMRDDLEGTV